MVISLFFLFLALASSNIMPDQSHPYPISPSSPNAGETSVDYWFYISIDNRINKGDYLNIIFPSKFTDISMSGITTCLVNGVSHSCSRLNANQAQIQASQVIPGNSRLQVKIPGITNPSSETGTSWFQINSQYYVGGQIIDSNDAFGVIGFAPTVSSVTGTIAIDSSGGTSVVGVSGNYIFTITLTSAILAGTQFRVKVPSPYAITSTTNCTVVTTSTLLGTFSCSKINGNLLISGLASNVTSGTVVSIKVSGILNPSYVIAASTVNFIIETLRQDTKIVIHRASIANILGVAGTVTGISLASFTASSRFTEGNSLYTTLTFITATKIPQGGSISLVYDATIDSSSCLVLSGVPNTSSGARPSCSITGSTVTISSFGAIAAKTTIKIVNLVTGLSANIGEVQISTYYSGSNLIDEDLTHGGVTMESVYSFNSGSISYSTTALDKGKITISINPYYNVATSDVINIYLPNNFTVTSTQTYTCRINAGSSWVTPTAFSVVNGIFSITIDAGTTFSTGSAAQIELGASGTGIQFPPNATSNSNIIEWVIGITHSANSEAGTLQSTLDKAAFVTGSGHTEISYAQDLSNYSPYTFKIQTDLDLWNSGTRKFMLSLEFPSDYADDLGTGLSSAGSIPIYRSSFTTTNYTTPLSCILTPGSPPNIVISGFDPIKAGTIISFTFFIQNPTSAGSGNIQVTTYYKDYNSITTICQQGDLAVTYASTSTTWDTMTVTTRNSTVVSTSTWFILDLLLSSSSVANNYLMINFPAGFTIDTKNFLAKIDGTSVAKYVIYANSYQPSIVLSLETVILNANPSNSNELILEGIINAPYVGSGSGDICVGLIDGTSQILSYLAETLSAITSGTLTVSVIPNSYISDHCDVTYKFSLSTAYGIPSGGTVQITFPVGFDLTYYSCSYSYSLSSASACTKSGQTISVTGFGAVASGTSFNINVLSVKNPNAGASGTFSIFTTYTSTTSTVIETKTAAGFTLTTSSSGEYSNIYKIAFYPNTSGTKGQMQLDFALNSSVPTQGNLIIEFPSSFSSLPSTMTNLNCLLNVQYTSCSISSQTITIIPATSFPTGINMTLIIPEITVPSTSTTPVKISVVWDSTTMAQNPSNPGSSFYITTGTVTAGVIQGTLTAWPKNAAEIAFYQFVLKSATGITTSTQILVFFPPEFPRNLGDLMAYSNCSTRMDGKLLIVSKGIIHGVLIQGFVAVASNQPFTVLFEGVRNPTSSTTTSTFSIVTLLNGAIIDSLSTSLSVYISSIPSIMDVVSINLKDYSIRATTDYTFLANPSSIPSTFQIWVWFPFPQFSIELYGLGDTFTCSSKAISKTTGASTSWLSSTSTPTCSNTHKNLVVLDALGSGFSSSNNLQVTISSLKSTGYAGVVNNFVMMIFDKSSLSATYRNYGIASTDDAVEYSEDKAQIFVGSQDARISVSPGTTSNFTIYVSSEYMPTRQTLTFTYTILGNNATANIVIEPNVIQIAQGESSVTCYVTCSADIVRGNYTIKWNMTGDTYGLYSEPAFTLLDVSSRRIVQRKVSFEGIPTLMIGATSIPLYVYLEAAPEEGLTIIASPPSLITVSAISFLPGQFVTSFTVTVNSTAYVGSQTINFTLSGTNSNWFYLDSSSITFDLTNYDITAPAISSFIVNNPKNRNFIDITMQTSEACTIYWTFGERGLTVPSNDTLIGSAKNKTAGYHLEYIGDSWLYNFRVDNLIAEHDYVMYGILVDLNNNEMDSVFSVDLYTDDLPDSVQITVQFGSLAPTADQAQSTVIAALSTLLDYDQSLISYVQPTSRMLDTLTSASYIIYNSATSTALAPSEIVRYMLNSNDLNRLLVSSNITIDLTYNIVKSMTYISNPRPTWYTYPTVKTTTNTTVSVTLAVTTSGTLYAEIIPDGDEIPSSRQVTLGLDAFAAKTTVISQAIVANTSVTVTYTGMSPASSYTIVITAKNNNSRLPRIMSDRVMAALEIITAATSATTTTTSDGTILFVSCILSLFL